MSLQSGIISSPWEIAKPGTLKSNTIANAVVNKSSFFGFLIFFYFLLFASSVN
jgi:hypothetical protein